MKIRQAHGLDYGREDDGSFFMILLDSRGQPFAMITMDVEGADELAEFIDMDSFDCIGEVAGHA